MLLFLLIFFNIFPYMRIILYFWLELYLALRKLILSSLILISLKSREFRNLIILFTLIALILKIWLEFFCECHFLIFFVLYCFFFDKRKIIFIFYFIIFGTYLIHWLINQLLFLSYKIIIKILFCQKILNLYPMN